MMLRPLSASTLILLSTPAWADITADDLWANTTAIYAATGGDLTATMLREENAIFVEDVRVLYKLPFDMGTINLALPPKTLIEQDDGTVEMIVPKTQDFAASFEGGPFLPMSFAVTGRLSLEDLSTIASGDPGAVTYTISAGSGSGLFEFIIEEEFTGPFGMELNVAFDGYSATTTVTEGDLLVVETDTSNQPMSMNILAEEGYGFRSEGTFEIGLSRSNGRIALPASGVDFMNLSTAFASGMALEMTTTSAYTSDSTITYYDNEVVTRDSSTSGVSNSTASISSDGLDFSGDVADLSFMFEEQEYLEILARGGADFMSARIAMPLMASDDPQDVIFAMKMDGIELDDGTWDLFDAGGALPRETANLNIDLLGTIVTSVDLVDFTALQDAFYGFDLPIQPQTVTINAMDLDIAGASVNGSGAFTFDSTDLETFSGLPRPEGEAAIAFSGVNALLDSVIAAGILPESDVSMGRMTLGMFTKSTGDDQSEATVIINPEGDLIVNGQRIR